MSEYEDNYNGKVIHLVDGEEFDFDNPLAGEITLHTVAHSLARIQRFGGHHQALNYSVAEHAIIVSYVVEHLYNDRSHALAALHHDDAEFATGDLMTPFKNWLKEQGAPIKELEREINLLVAQTFDIPVDDLKAGVIKDADVLVYAAEIDRLKPAGHGAMPEVDPELLEQVKDLIEGLDPKSAEQVYAFRHQELTGTLKLFKKVEMTPEEIEEAGITLPRHVNEEVRDPFNGPQPEVPDTFPIDWDKDDPADPR